MLSGVRIALTVSLAAACSFAQQPDARSGPGMPSDWSQRHLVVTDAATPEARLLAEHDPRLRAQWQARARALAARPEASAGAPGDKRRSRLHRDWSVPLGAGGVAPAMSPAKFTFNVNATPSCASDYVVWGLNVPGVSNHAVATVTAAGAVRNTNVVTITTAAAHGFSVGQNVTISGVTDSIFDGAFVIASVPTATTFTYAQTGANATSGSGTATVDQANLIALNNLYSGTTGGAGLCGSGDASVMWAYNVSTAGGSILTSPAISLDGLSIAFVESVGGGSPASIFHILTYDPCTISVTPNTSCQALSRSNGTDANNPVVPGSGNLATLSSLTYAAATNSRSSLWVDYHNNVAYVGADNATIYRILHVFDGGVLQVDPAWSVTLSANCSNAVATPAALTGPVQVLGASGGLDTGFIFIGDSTGCLTAVDVATHTVIGSINVGGHKVGSLIPPVYDSPIVDVSDPNNLSVFATASSSNNASSLNTAAIVQAKLVTAGPTFSQVAAVSLGSGATGAAALNLHAPAFDNTYIATPGSGAIWACGTRAAGTQPALYRIPFVAGTPPAMNGASATNQNITFFTGGECSPITEFSNPNITPNDLIFFGATTNTNRVFSWNVTGASIPAGPTANAAATSGTSGIVVDNTQLTTQQGSSIYFSTLGVAFATCNNLRCAVKLTQSGLQ